MIARMQEEAEANMTEMDKARDMLKMKTVKIRQASAEVGPNSRSPFYIRFPQPACKMDPWTCCVSNARKTAVQLLPCTAFADLVDAMSNQVSCGRPCERLCPKAWNRGAGPHSGGDADQDAEGQAADEGRQAAVH